MKYHFYTSNYLEWRVSSNLVELVKWFDKYEQPYVICLVPLDIKADYKIIDYLPNVKDLVILGTYRKGEKVED